MPTIDKELSLSDLSEEERAALIRRLQEMATLGGGYDLIQASMRKVNEAVVDLIEKWASLEKQMGALDLILCGKQEEKLRALHDVVRDLELPGEDKLPPRDTGKRGRRNETLRRAMVGIARDCHLSFSAIVDLLEEAGVEISVEAVELDCKRLREQSWDVPQKRPGRPKEARLATPKRDILHTQRVERMMPVRFLVGERIYLRPLETDRPFKRTGCMSKTDRPCRYYDIAVVRLRTGTVGGNVALRAMRFAFTIWQPED